MPNHVDIIIIPADEDGLWRTYWPRFAMSRSTRRGRGWSNLRAHLAGKEDEVVRVAPALEWITAMETRTGITLPLGGRRVRGLLKLSP